MSSIQASKLVFNVTDINRFVESGQSEHSIRSETLSTERMILSPKKSEVEVDLQVQTVNSVNDLIYDQIFNGKVNNRPTVDHSG